MNDYSNPLILTDQEMKPYLAAPGLSSTGLAYFDDSMAKGKAYLDGLIRIEGKHLDLGTAVHSYMEDREGFWNRYIKRPPGMDRRTKQGKADYAEFEIACGAKTILEWADWQTVEGIAESMDRSNDLLIKMVMTSPGENETSFFWKEAGLDHKCRADRLVHPEDAVCAELCERFPELFDRPFGLKIVVDYKTTSKPADPKSFYWTAKSFKYPLKSAHYLAGTGADAFLWVVMETSAPYHVTRYLMSPSSMDFYSRRRLELLEQIRECEATGEWPGLVITDAETLI